MKSQNVMAIIAGGAIGLLIAQSIPQITPKELVIGLKPAMPYIYGTVMLIGIMASITKYLCVEEERDPKKFTLWLIVTNIIVAFIVGVFKFLEYVYL